ncbi:MAG: ATP-binding cassette domain-containing protein [Sulfolobales archaeon]
MKNLSLIGIVKRYSGFILRVERLDIEEASVICIRGPNGSGKTTLLNIIAGVIEPDEGRIIFNGIDITRTEPEKRRFPLIRGEKDIFPHMSVARNISIARRVDRKELETIMEILGIDGRIARKRASELSTGWKIRVALARALASNPSVILVDEGFDHLDSEYVKCCLKNIVRYAKEKKITILAVTHKDLDICEKTIIMKEGNIDSIIEKYAEQNI